MSLAEVKLTSDITRLGVGARPLGMGKMFTGLADDISAMYLNPAGLAHIDKPQLLSMSGKFVNLVNYLSFAAVLPGRFGTAGVGYSGSGMGFSTPVLNLTEIATGEYRIIPSSTEAVSYDYTNYAVAFSWGTTVLRPDLSLGTTLKLFHEKISGAARGTASGQDMDVGLMFKPEPRLTIGLVAKNILPYSMGGKTRWDTGLEEAIPSSANIGASLKVEGLVLGADYEFRPAQSNVPGFWHTGVEWWVAETFALRAGVDQDVIGAGSGSELDVTSNPTAGISLLFSGFRFDYAYHRYNDIATNDTHYFSIAYLFQEEIPISAFSLSEPKDRSVTEKETLWVTGEVMDTRKVRELWLNGSAIEFEENGRFTEEIPLQLNLNLISLEAFDRRGKTLKSESVKVLRLMSFADVKPPYFAALAVEYLATLGMATGYPDGTFKPMGDITRAEMCTMLMKARGQKFNGNYVKTTFKDVGPTHWAAPYVAQAAKVGIVKGYPDGTFRPNGPISRAEGVTMIARFDELSVDQVLEAPFPDVPGRHWSARSVTAAKQAGLLKYLEGKGFEPNQKLTRGETAEILYRTRALREKIAGLWLD